MKLLCLACPKNACFLLPLQSKHGVTQLLPNIYPCPKLPKIHPISPGFNTLIHGHWHRTKSRVEFCFDAFSALSRQPANWGTKRKTRLGIPQVGGARGVGWWVVGGGCSLEGCFCPDSTCLGYCACSWKNKSSWLQEFRNKVAEANVDKR